MNGTDSVGRGLWVALVVPPAVWVVYVLTVWAVAVRGCGAGAGVHVLSALAVTLAAAASVVAVRYARERGASDSPPEPERFVAGVASVLGPLLTAGIALAWLLAAGVSCEP